MITRYQKRISGPLLERIDIHLELPRIDYQQLSDKRGRIICGAAGMGGSGGGAARWNVTVSSHLVQERNLDLAGLGLVRERAVVVSRVEHVLLDRAT